MNRLTLFYLVIATGVVICPAVEVAERVPLPLPERSLVKPRKQLARDAEAKGLARNPKSLQPEFFKISPAHKNTRYIVEYTIETLSFNVPTVLLPNLPLPMIQGEASRNPRIEDLADEDALFTAESVRSPVNVTGPMQAEIVVGTDSRIKFGPETDVLYPFSSVVKIYAHFQELGWYEATGTMIGPRHVLTVGHALYDWEFNLFADTIRVVPAMNGDSKPFGETYAIKTFMNTGWATYGRPEHDMGLIALNEPIGLQTGWMGYATLSNTQIKQLKPRCIGYPGDLDDGEQMYYSIDTLFKSQPYTPFFVKYILDSAGGESGAAIFRYLNGYPFVYAVHAYGSDNENDLKDHNVGVRLTKEKTTLIYHWLRQPLPAPVPPAP